MSYVQHTVKDTIKVNIVKNNLIVIINDKKITSIDICIIYDMMHEKLSINSKNPGVRRRARKIRQYYAPDDAAPGPFMNP
jgi:hypothetical protein